MAIKAKYKDSCKWSQLDLIPPRFIKSDTQKPKVQLMILRHLWKMTNLLSHFFPCFVRNAKLPLLMHLTMDQIQPLKAISA